MKDMAAPKEYTDEQLNYFKICYVTTDILAEGLRTIFKQEWDSRYKTTFGEWKDYPGNGRDFYGMESPRNQRRFAYILSTMIRGNRAEWDSTMLFCAILYSDCIYNLNPVVRKNVNDLRIFRNDFAHMPQGQLSELDFKYAIGKVVAAFQALGLSTEEIQQITNQKTFPSEELRDVFTLGTSGLQDTPMKDMAAAKEYTDERLNYFKICYVTTDILAEGLRTIFKQEWDSRYKTTFGEWEDYPKNGRDFYGEESPRNQRRFARILSTMIKGNRAEWDSTMLFYAILYSDCIYSLNPVVRENVENLRKFSSKFAHMPQGRLSEFDFKYAIGKVIAAFEALGLSTEGIQQITNQKTELRDVFTTVTPAPLEILSRGPSAVLAYHKALSEGKTVVKRLPIMFIGQSKSGKTSLKRSLKGERFKRERTITKGIETDPSYCTVSQEVWKLGESGNKATNSDPAPFSYEKCTAQCIFTSLKEELNSKEMKNVDVSNLEGGIDPSYSKVSQEVEATNSDEEEIKLKEIENAGTVEEVHARPDAPELKEVPVEIVTLVENLFQLKEAEGAQGKEGVCAVLWDFGGQSVYYATHPIFLTPRAIYLLVNNLSDDPHVKVSPQVRRGFYKDIEDDFCERSNMDYLDLWMSSVSSLVVEDEDLQEMLASEILPERLPPVFLVCTHADEPFQDSDPHALAREVFGALRRRVYGKHLYDVFVVDNTKSGSVEKCPEVDRLRREVETVVNELPQMKEAIPIKWLKFEEEMKEKNQDGHKWISLDEAKKIATEKCGISSTEQFVAMLNFLHDQRILIHFDDTPQLNRMVILDPQWLIDVFKEVITIRPYQSQERKYEDLWLKLETTGILKEELLQHVWGPLFDNRETCHTLITMMEKFCLLCRLSSSVATDSPTEYLVPSMLKFPPEEDVSELIAFAGIPSLYLKFKSSQVPIGLFPRVVLMVFQWCKEEFSSQEQPQLHQNFARFYTHPAEGCSLILKCHSSFIEVVVHKKRCAAGLSSNVAPALNLPSESTYDAFQVDFARAVCRRLGLILECMRIEFPWLKNMAYDLLVCCPVCSTRRSVNYCSNHKVHGCKEEQCLHLLSESQLLASRGSIVCTRSVFALNCEVPVDLVGFWFGSLEEQQPPDGYDEKSPLPNSGDAHNDQAVVLCGEVLEALTTQTCNVSDVVAQFQQSLSLENLSLEQPDPNTKKKIRHLCLKAKTANKLEVVKKLREITPAGTTGPLLPEEYDVTRIPLCQREELTMSLSAGDDWKVLAESLGLTSTVIKFFDKRCLNPCDAALDRAREKKLIQSVGDLYDRLVDCEFPVLADLL